MKRFLIIVSIVFSINYAFSTEIKTISQITNVTVYLQGASVYNKTSLNIPKGESSILLTDLPSMVNEESIQINSNGDFAIMNVKFQKSWGKSQIIDSLEKAQNKLSDKIIELTNTKEVYQDEIEILDKNKNIKGDNSNLNIAELDKILKYYQTQLLDLKSKIISVEKSIKETTTELKKIQSELNIYKESEKKGEIAVTVLSNKAQKIELDFSYYITCANWIPCYDVRVNKINEPLQITYKAKIFQTSGLDWNNVKVTLSTGNPSLNGNVPVLDKWVINGNIVNSEYNKNMEIMDTVVTAFAAKHTTAVSEEKINMVEFVIPENLSLKSSQVDILLTISQNLLPAEYIYKCIPKLDKNAYLLAKVCNFSKLNYLSGEASLFLEGSFVGKSNVNMTQATDTLTFSLGQDAGIIVERTIADDFTKKIHLSKNYKQAIGWNINIRNNKQSNITIEIQDNIPVSANSSIKVENLIYSNATITSENILTWNLKLNPAETKKVAFSYTVTYPKELSLNLN